VQVAVQQDRWDDDQSAMLHRFAWKAWAVGQTSEPREVHLDFRLNGRTNSSVACHGQQLAPQPPSRRPGLAKQRKSDG
jgi:hypothetical protein